MNASQAVKTALKPLFVSWAAARGLRVVASIHVDSKIGDVALVVRKGCLVSIEQAVALDASQSAMIAAGFSHGYAYPLLNKSVDVARSFLSAR